MRIFSVAWILVPVVLISAFVFSAPIVTAKHTSTNDASHIRFKEGEKKLKEKDYDGAIDSFLQAIYLARNNYYPEAYFDLGFCYRVKRQDSKAIEALKTSIEQSLESAPNAHLELGKIYMRNNRDQEAINEFQQAMIGANAHTAEAQNALGLLAQKRQDYMGAEYNFLAALGDRPWWYSEAWVNLAENMMKQQKWTAALENLNEMLDRGNHLKDLNKPKVYMDIGLCMMAKGNHQGALENWRMASSLKPDWALPHEFLGQMFDKESHISSAVAEYRSYLQLAPDNDPDRAAIKSRIVVLEQALNSAPESPAPKPTPYSQPPRVPSNLDSGF